MLTASSGNRVYASDPFRGLDPRPVINGVARKPAFLYRGGAVKGTSGSAVWMAGAGNDDLTEIGAGIAVDPKYYSLLFNGSNSLVGGDITTGDLSTDDMVIEIWLKSAKDAGSDKGIIWKEENPTNRFYLFHSVTNVYKLQLGDPLGVGPVIVSPSIALDTLGYLFGYVNRNEASTDGAKFWLNNVAGVGVDFSAISAVDLTFNSVFNVGLGPSNAFDNEIMWMAMWRAPNMIQAGAAGEAEMDALQAARYATLRPL